MFELINTGDVTPVENILNRSYHLSIKYCGSKHRGRGSCFHGKTIIADSSVAKDAAYIYGDLPNLKEFFPPE